MGNRGKPVVASPERHSMMMPTLDDWSPCHVLENHPSGITTGVKVSFIELRPWTMRGRIYARQWRVCIWGNDDLGMERDYPDDEEAAARAMYDAILLWETVDRYELVEHGFGWA